MRFPFSGETMKLHVYTGAEVKARRKALGLVQADFWGLFGATQSAGSRYESEGGREIPEPIQILLNIALASDAKASTIVQSLRTLGKPPKQDSKPKVPLGFGRL